MKFKISCSNYEFISFNEKLKEFVVEVLYLCSTFNKNRITVLTETGVEGYMYSIALEIQVKVVELHSVLMTTE